ncbi:ogr/Delta-like zinc finger family protein [Burkholderia ambifaria]|jgi:DNA-directed RNA polymerase subunit RPC12/RpoP|uniref:ogr/Delta-like zinc finger family protein n=1 Tax=Burkholderia ambifaria TaxID=152480 RepID=UPI00158B6DE8|nr:ogr/Delta-like zinc finger family protein [Burkholderia ambifaria]
MYDMTIQCPACAGAIEARHSERMSDTMRRLYFWCPECGFRAPATLEVLHSLSPPAYPREGLDLPVKPDKPLGGSINSRTAKRPEAVGV